jgi:uncharacterized protein
MQNNKNYFYGLVAIIIFSLLCYHFWTPVNIDNIKYVKIAGQSIKVDLADTPELRERGLSGRKGLKEDEGMLFVFDRPGQHLFWMKDMYFAIDIIWIDEDSKVIYIKKDAQPEMFLETYGPSQDVPIQVGIPTSVGAKYVLEVVSGFADKHNLKEGDRVEFIY